MNNPRAARVAVTGLDLKRHAKGQQFPQDHLVLFDQPRQSSA